MSRTPEGWLRRRSQFDRGVALVGLVVLAPVLAAIAGLVLLADRHHPFVGLARIGQGGRPFTLWKLRTMHPGAAAGEAITLGDDDRVTALGRHLRRYRADELPQLWNVARGEMALLGPRPEAPDFVDPEVAGWQAALAARPGIAGATQVVIHRWESSLDSTATYRDEVLPRKLEIDQWYLAHASPVVDFDVCRSVLRSVLDPERETPIHRRLVRELPETMAAIAVATSA